MEIFDVCTASRNRPAPWDPISKLPGQPDSAYDRGPTSLDILIREPYFFDNRITNTCSDIERLAKESAPAEKNRPTRS